MCHRCICVCVCGEGEGISACMCVQGVNLTPMQNKKICDYKLKDKIF